MNIVNMRNDTALNPDNVLDKAKGEYESVFVIGYDHEGIMDARSTTNLNAAQILFLLECFKNKLLNGDYADD